MRTFLRKIFQGPIIYLVNHFSSAPKKAEVYKALSNLITAENNILFNKIVELDVDTHKQKFIIFSDQHKGNKSWADDFKGCQLNYVSALDYYYKEGYTFICLGDAEELWKFTTMDIMKNSEKAFLAEAQFHPERFIKVFGNHDLVWKDKIQATLMLSKYFTAPIPVFEGVKLSVNTESKPFTIFLTHGHQGDAMSDGNPVSSWIVAHIWTPIQRYLRINVNSASSDYSLRSLHNKLMYTWSSSQKDLLLVTGHTHQPVFASGRYFKHPSNKINVKEPHDELTPSYFNTGCCCYSDGDITGIEIADGKIRLIKWCDEEIKPRRGVLEEISFEELLKNL